MHEFQTTSLKSRAGTGVAGVFAEESAFLNPAGIAFFQINSVFFQRDMMQFKDADGNNTDKPKNTAISLNEGNGSLSGTLSYISQNEGPYKRSRWGTSMAAMVGGKSAFGFSVRKTTDKNTDTNEKEKYYQTVFGVLHAITPQTTLGVVAYDAFKSKGNATRAYVGLQHNIADYISLSFDAGSDWNAEEISDAAIYRGAVQIRVMNNFFLRYGMFDDKLLREKGNGFGISWIQPRLALEFGVLNVKNLEDKTLNIEETKRKDVSFSVSLKM